MSTDEQAENGPGGAWSDKDVDRLILEYELRPSLYQTEREDYKNKKERARKWAEIIATPVVTLYSVRRVARDHRDV